MKSIYLLLLLFCNLSFAQKFIINETGLKSESDSDKNFVVINSDLDSITLYNKTIEYINRTYKNPEKVIKGNVQDKYIRVDTYSPNVTRFKGMYPQNISIDFNIEFEFKKGKVKHTYSNINYKTDNGQNFDIKRSDRKMSWTWYFLYTNKGELKNVDQKNDIENYFNQLLNNYIQTISSKNTNW